MRLFEISPNESGFFGDALSGFIALSISSTDFGVGGGKASGGIRLFVLFAEKSRSPRPLGVDGIGGLHRGDVL